MNAKKIMGAVLVALLAAALFVGAGAAADATNIGEVSAYTDLSGLSPSALADGKQFAADDNSGAIIVTLDGNGNPYIAAGANQLNKQYTGNGITFKLVAPTAPVLAIDQITGANIIGQTISAAVANSANFQVAGAYAGADVVFINKDGVRYNGADWNPRAFTAGEWGVAANLTGKTGLASDIAVQGAIYTFTVIETEGTIVAVKDTLNIGNTIVIKISYPGQKTADVIYNKEYVTPIDDQEDVTIDATNGKVTLRLASDGTQTVAFTANKAGEAKFTLDILSPGDDVSVTVTIEKGVLTAQADADSFFVGNPIAISGTTTAGTNLRFFIEGQNFLFTEITSAKGTSFKEKDGAWSVEFEYSLIEDANGKTLVAGTYPIIVSIYDGNAAGLTPAELKKAAMGTTYASATVTLTQPFITGVDAPAVVVQGDAYKITGTAYATENVKLYVFGTNYFAVQSKTTDKDEQFEFDILTEAITEDMAVGTYFFLIQHPMKDKVFNVWNGSVTPSTSDAYAGHSATTGDMGIADFFYAATQATEKEATFIFNAYTRGTNYAAQALLEAIAGQDIDDIFVQGTFEVEAQKLVINDIPAEVAKGTALTISGYTNSGEGTEVIVNVLSGKFGATVKGDENAALFLTAKAVSKEDGTFEATIDTSKLELGNYVVTVEIGGIQYDTAAVAIVAASAPVTPVDPVDPVDPKPVDPQPTEPETPGFGALAALAGLGAVAVLLLRRE